MNSSNQGRNALRGLVATALFTGSLGVQAAQGDWLVRLRALWINPQDDSTEVSVAGAPVGNTGVGVTDDWIPELDFTYMFMDNWGVEVILGVSNHEVTPQDGLPAVLGNSNHIIDADVLPPTVTLQYHFFPEAKFRPYVGVGVNYTLFFNEKVKGALEAPGSDVSLDSSWGVALQGGFDYAIDDNWFVNFDVKWIDIDTGATFSNTALGPVPVTVDVNVEPLVIGFGIGRRF